MLASILIALTVVFLGGIAIIVRNTNFQASDLVAILSPALGAISTVAAGVFGYSIGSRGSAQAQEAATRESATARQQMGAKAAKADLANRSVSRIVDAALSGSPTPDGKRELSVEDLTTLRNAAADAATNEASEPLF